MMLYKQFIYGLNVKGYLKTLTSVTSLLPLYHPYLQKWQAQDFSIMIKKIRGMFDQNA